ncbi:hypothetical protein ACHQM5_010610 [Ranunculus cassubicifolius]
MTTIQASGLKCSSSSSSSKTIVYKSSLHAPKINSISISFPKSQTGNLAEEMNMRNQFPTTAPSTSGRDDERPSNSLVMAELYAILETVYDRIEMHANIGEQRNNWNTLLLTSINAITISAATMAGLASIAGSEAPILALKLSSTLLYSAATSMLLVMNKIQPSQLAEEQRNAVRLFKQLLAEIQTVIHLGAPAYTDVKIFINKVLALDKAFPLPLLGGVMLEKFPSTVKPAVWWPQQGTVHKYSTGKAMRNGWNAKLEEEMRSIIGILDRKDSEEYMRLSKLVLKVNTVLAISGPLLTGIAAFGSTLVGSPNYGTLAAVFAVVGGALASVVNTVEHGGQVGMVFEMYRNCAGSFQQLRESIESVLQEKAVERRENGDLFEMKVALQLGRSLSGLRNLAKSSDSGASQEFGSKLL